MIEHNIGTPVRFIRKNLMWHIMTIIINNLIETPCSDRPKKFWRFVKSKRQDNIGKIMLLYQITMGKQTFSKFMHQSM